MTSNKHQSGTDRILEVADKYELPDNHIIVNVQGDEPLIPPELIHQVATLLDFDNSYMVPQVKGRHSVATLCEIITSISDIENPHIVKVVCDVNGKALYFSRAPIPFSRDGSHSGIGHGGWRKHIGIYAYRVGVLRKFVGLHSQLEGIERLEQLRFLENGIDVIVGKSLYSVPTGVDTLSDAERVRYLLRKNEE